LRKASLALLLLFPLAAAAEVAVKDAWVRGTVAAQTTTAAYMTITSSEDAKLVAVESSAARSAEVHSSSMKGGVMRMEAAGAIALPAGKPVRLSPPSGFHVMLIGVKALKAGDKVPLVLAVEGKDGKRTMVEVQAEVRALGQ
jgi:copper(I)-binding protein